MTTAPPGWLTDHGTEQEALIREARRRQRRRSLAAGVASATVLATAAMIIASSRAGSRPGPPGSHGSPITPARNAPPAAVPQSRTNPGRSCYDGGDVARRQAACLRRLGWTMAVSSDLKGKPRAVGATGFFAPSATRGHVWLVRFLGGYLGQGPVRTWSAPLSGGAASPALTLPAGENQLIRGTDGGLLLQGRPGQVHRLALWTPGSAPRNLPDSHENGISDGFDATACLVAYGSDWLSRFGVRAVAL